MADLWCPMTTACKTDCGMHDLGYVHVYLLVSCAPKSPTISANMTEGGIGRSVTQTIRFSLLRDWRTV